MIFLGLWPWSSDFGISDGCQGCFQKAFGPLLDVSSCIFQLLRPRSVLTSALLWPRSVLFIFFTSGTIYLSCTSQRDCFYIDCAYQLFFLNRTTSCPIMSGHATHRENSFLHRTRKSAILPGCANLLFFLHGAVSRQPNVFTWV